MAALLLWSGVALVPLLAVLIVRRALRHTEVPSNAVVVAGLLLAMALMSAGVGLGA